MMIKNLYCKIQTNLKYKFTHRHLFEQGDSKNSFNIVINKFGFYLTEEDVNGLVYLSYIMKKKINLNCYFNAYVIYNILINKKNDMEKSDIVNSIYDDLAKYNLDYDKLKKLNITDKAIFLMFFYKKAIGGYYENLKHMVNCESKYYCLLEENKLKRKDTVYLLKTINNNQNEKIIRYQGNEIPDNIENILQFTNNQSIIHFNHGIINVLSKYTKPIFVQAYYVDVLYIKNGDQQTLTDMISKFKYTSVHIVNQIQLMYGDNVTTHGQVISENSKDKNSESILNLIYSRQFDGSVFKAGQNTVGVVVVHRQFLIPKEYRFHRKKVPNFTKIISAMLESHTAIKTL